MKATYEWRTNDNGERELVVRNLQTHKSITIRKADGVVRVSGSRLYGAIDNDELLVAKIVADRSGDIDAIARWLTNATDADRVQRMVDALLGAKLEEARAKMRDAGIEPNF